MGVPKMLFCGTGGFAGFLATLLWISNYWWLGLFTGAAVGYLAYKFIEYSKTLPEPEVGVAQPEDEVTWGDTVAGVKAWFSQKHPFFYLGNLFGMIIFLTIIGLWFNTDMMFKSMITMDQNFWRSLMPLFVFYAMATGVMMLIMAGLATIGSRKWEKSFFLYSYEMEMAKEMHRKTIYHPSLPLSGSETRLHEEIQKLHKKRLGYKEPTEKDIYRWVGKGLLYIVYGIWLKDLACFICVQAYLETPVLYIIFGILGGGIGLYLSSTDPELFFICGITFGCVLSSFTRQIISERCPHLQVNTTS